MKVNVFLLVIMLLEAGVSYGQTKKHYHAGTVGHHDKIRLILNAPSVSCRINPTYSMHAVNVFGYPGDSNFNPVEKRQAGSSSESITLNFEENIHESLSTSLSAKVFGQAENIREKPWYVYLSRNNPFDLELNYGMGSSSVDLTGLAVEKFTINTGSAEIRVGFDGNIPNQVKMDTLRAKVDLGVLELDKLNLARASEVIAQIGFGKLHMRLTETNTEKSHIVASVGAGTLEVLLDDINIPVIIRIKNSPLCRIKMQKAFKEIEPEVFVNDAYRPDAKDLVSFTIDVAMGNVIFRTTP